MRALGDEPGAFHVHRFRRRDRRQYAHPLTTDHSPAIPITTVFQLLEATKAEDIFVDDNGYRDFMKTTL